MTKGTEFKAGQRVRFETVTMEAEEAEDWTVVGFVEKFRAYEVSKPFEGTRLAYAHQLRAE